MHNTELQSATPSRGYMMGSTQNTAMQCRPGLKEENSAESELIAPAGNLPKWKIIYRKKFEMARGVLK